AGRRARTAPDGRTCDRGLATGFGGGSAGRPCSGCPRGGSGAPGAAAPRWAPGPAAGALATAGSPGPARPARRRARPPAARSPAEWRAPAASHPPGAVRIALRPVAGGLRRRHHLRPQLGVLLDLARHLAALCGRLRVHEPLGVAPDPLAPALDHLEPANVVERIPARVGGEEERVVALGHRVHHRLVRTVENLVHAVVVGLAR